MEPSTRRKEIFEIVEVLKKQSRNGYNESVNVGFVELF